MFNVKEKYHKMLKSWVLEMIAVGLLFIVFDIAVFALAVTDGDSNYAARLYLYVIPTLTVFALVLFIIAAVHSQALRAVNKITYANVTTEKFSCYKIKTYTYATKFFKEIRYLKLFCLSGDKKRTFYYVYGNAETKNERSLKKINELKELIREKEITLNYYVGTDVIEDGYKID